MRDYEQEDLVAEIVCGLPGVLAGGKKGGEKSACKEEVRGMRQHPHGDAVPWLSRQPCWQQAPGLQAAPHPGLLCKSNLQLTLSSLSFQVAVEHRASELVQWEDLHN